MKNPLAGRWLRNIGTAMSAEMEHHQHSTQQRAEDYARNSNLANLRKRRINMYLL
jgi:hypothetical protein